MNKDNLRRRNPGLPSRRQPTLCVGDSHPPPRSWKLRRRSMSLTENWISWHSSCRLTLSRDCSWRSASRAAWRWSASPPLSRQRGSSKTRTKGGRGRRASSLIHLTSSLNTSTHPSKVWWPWWRPKSAWGSARGGKISWRKLSNKTCKSTIRTSSCVTKVKRSRSTVKEKSTIPESSIAFHPTSTF